MITPQRNAVCQKSNAATARRDGLDREQSTSRFYRRLDSDAKRRAKLSFVAYISAVADGDTALIAATRERFMQASAELAKARNV